MNLVNTFDLCHVIVTWCVFVRLQPYRRARSPLCFLEGFPFFLYGPVLMAELFMMSAPPVDGTKLEVLGFLESFGEDNSTAERCFRSHSRSSVLQGLPFGGVPTVLAINVVIWMVRGFTDSYSTCWTFD